MTISKNKMVSLSYELKIDGENGRLIEQTTSEEPMKFIFGTQRIFPVFESKIKGLEEGNDFKVCIKSEEAYGPIDDKAIVDLPKNIFELEGKFDSEKIKVGNVIPMSTENGQQLQGMVLDVFEETVKMNFNHPLAGKDLYFSGKVIEVRDATEKEIADSTNEHSCNCEDGNCTCGEGNCECGEGEGSCDCDEK